MKKTLKLADPKKGIFESPAVNCSAEVRAQAFQLASELIDDDFDQEHFIVIACNNKNVPLEASCVAFGTMNTCEVDMKMIFRFLLKVRYCNRFFVVHNHPSGDPSPSGSDMALTRRIRDAAEIVGYSLVDHIIIVPANDKYFSFRDSGILAG